MRGMMSGYYNNHHSTSSSSSVGSSTGRCPPPTPPPSTTTTAVADAEDSEEASSLSSSSRLQSILAAGHDQLRRIDELEDRIDERAVRARRRICNILEHTEPFRRSHLRCFLTHAYYKQQQQQQTAAQPMMSLLSPPSSPLWTLRLEGRLLIGHLDHASAEAYDHKTGYTPPNDDLDRSKGETEEEAVGKVQFTHFFDKITVQFQSIYSPKLNPMAAAFLNKTTMPAAATSASSSSASSTTVTSPAMSKKRQRGSNTKSPMGGASGNKSAGGAGSGAGGAGAVSTGNTTLAGIDPRRPFMQSDRTEMVWTKQGAAALADAQAFDFEYQAPPPPDGSYQEHSVVCHVQLYPNDGSASNSNYNYNNNNNKEALYYQVSPELSNALFPHHGPSEHSQAAAAAAAAAATATATGAEIPAVTTAAAASAAPPPSSSTKKRKADEADPNAPISAADMSPSSGFLNGPPPTDNSIEIPDGLSMKEIAFAFFTYIRDAKLCTGGGGTGDDRRGSMGSNANDNDPSGLGASLDFSLQIPCDETLQSLFHVDHFDFCNLQKLLIARDLIRPIHTEPIRLTYIMSQDTATSSTPPVDVKMSGMDDDEDAPHPALLQLDMDVAVPALFPYRARELLRRIKRRELEYTSSRTKARYLLMARRAKDEEHVKQLIDVCVSSKSKGSSVRQASTTTAGTTAASSVNGPSDLLTPVTAALAKAAPPRTEARMTAHLDTRLSYLLTQLQQHQQQAQAAWQQVQYQAAAAATTKKEHPKPE